MIDHRDRDDEAYLLMMRLVMGSAERPDNVMVVGQVRRLQLPDRNALPHFNSGRLPPPERDPFASPVMGCEAHGWETGLILHKLEGWGVTGCDDG